MTTQGPNNLQRALLRRLATWSTTARQLAGGQRDEVLRRNLYDFMGPWTSGLMAESKAPPGASSEALTFLVPTRDRHIGRDTFAVGGYDTDVMDKALALIREYCPGASLSGKVFVDVGANIGTSSVLALKRHGAASAIAVEPEPRNFDFLRCNMILNHLETRVDCRQLAVSCESGLRDLELSAINTGDHRIRVTSTEGEMSEERRSTITVRSAPLDSVLAETATDPADVGLVWVDTQGHEGHVLASASNLLQQRVPFVIEYWPYGLARSGGLDLLERTVQRHFRWFIGIRGSNPLPEAVDVLSTLRLRYGAQAYTDLLLIP